MSGLLRKRCRSGPLHSRMTKTDQRSSLHLSTPLSAIPTRMKTHRGPQRKRQQAWSRLLPLALFEVLCPPRVFKFGSRPYRFVKHCNTCIILTLAEVSVKAGAFYSCTPWKGRPSMRSKRHSRQRCFAPGLQSKLDPTLTRGCTCQARRP